MMIQHHWQCEGQDWQCQGKDSRQGGEGTLVKTHTGKMFSLWPVGCISDQFPTRGTPTTSLRLAQVCSRLVRGPRHTTRAPPPMRMEERISTSCRYNSWRLCRRPAPTRALMLVWPAARPSHRHHLPLCHTQTQPEALKHPLRRAQA
jgi:hypothetical protein